MVGAVQSEIGDDNFVVKAEEEHANKQEGEEEAVHVVIETAGENVSDSIPGHPRQLSIIKR